MPVSQKTLERRIVAVYAEAQKDLQKKLDDYIEKFRAKDAQMRQDLADEAITQKEYDEWRQGAIFQGKAWRARLKQVTDTLANANEESLRLVRGEQLNEFAEGMNHEQFVLAQNTGLSINFGIYDADTAGRLIREQPDLLPPKKLNRGKDERWNQKKVTGSILQGIIQGESIDDIARRIARDTAQQNSKAMIRYARTATTGAQNAGRMETMHRARGMGINIRKQWLATLDRRTRDSHQHLDGQEADVDEPFKSDFGDIMFPGDPSADPADVYNCRCTMVYVYPGYSADPGERLDNVTGEHVRGDITYDEWARTQPRAEESALQKKINKAAGNKPAAEAIRDSLANAYDYHIQKHGIRKISAEDVQKNAENGFGTGFKPDISKLDEQGQKNVASAMQKLCGEYDTPLDRIRTMTAQEAMGNSAFAFVWHNYETDSCEMVINPIKCKDTEKMVERLKHLRDKGYLPKGVTDEQLPEYIVTHEFGHTLLNMQEKLKNSRNLVGADYDAIRSARKEIETIYSEYAAEVGRIDKSLKKSEMDFIMNPTEEAQKRTRDLISEMDGVRISMYSLSDIDEFMAESFAGSRFGATSSPYAKRCMDVLDKYFKR